MNQQMVMFNSDLMQGDKENEILDSYTRFIL